MGIKQNLQVLRDIKQNLQVLRDFLQALPEQQIDLEQFSFSCGTIHCAGGWLPAIPHFEQMGVYWGGYGVPNIQGIDDAFEYLFGPDAYDRLFASNGGGWWDEELDPHEELTDKQLALARIDKALEAFQ